VNGSERKTVTAHLESANGAGEFAARLARLNAIDKDGDVALPGAFGSQVAPLLVSHQWNTIPLGKVWIRERADEVLAEGKINRGLEQGRALHEAMKFDLAHPPSEFEFSYGFQVLDAGPGTFQGQRVRFLKSVRVLEVSCVVAGAGDTRLLNVKHVEAADEDELRRRAETLLAMVTQVRLALMAAHLDALAEEAEEAQKRFRFRYRFINSPGANPRWPLACGVLKAAAAELGAPEPYLRFYRDAQPGEEPDFVSDSPLLGASNIPAHPRVVAVHEKLSRGAMIETIAHEVLHCVRPALPEEKAVHFAREFSRDIDYASRLHLVEVPIFVTADEARELRRQHQPVHYSKSLNMEFTVGVVPVPAQSAPRVHASGHETQARSVPGPVTGRPCPT
jgi:hypothetical protein